MPNNLTKEQQLIILGLVLIIISGLVVMGCRHFIPDKSEELVIEDPQQTIEKPRIIIHISGAVQREGVYRLNAGDRVVDALNLAGGVSANSNLSSINLAEKVKDGQKIIVPAKQKVIVRGPGDLGIGGSGTFSGKVSINAAGEKELCKIGGIGPSTAKRIIEYRSKNGPFSKIEDIMKVKRIGKGKFGKIKDEIII
ncbi:MAG: helix-hairpin-helix domain-containing protein [Candidatus Margulisiibacteriota bacterium]|nr:helix-hairpin-helix domain-containing protein [Candidatus Margulisiibacteriota bacterium]